MTNSKMPGVAGKGGDGRRKTEGRSRKHQGGRDGAAADGYPLLEAESGWTGVQETGKTYDLEDRTFEFAQAVRALAKKLPLTIANVEDIRQLVKASGSVGANYIEANEALGKKDFLMRLRISRKEAKESHYWLRLLDVPPEIDEERRNLVQEALDLKLIFSSILSKYRQHT